MKPRILTSTTNMSKDIWLEHRKAGIGGSEIAAIIGLNKYTSPIELWYEKTGAMRVNDGREPYVVNGQEWPSEAAYWGTVDEESNANHFAAVTGLKVQRRNCIYQHPKYPWMLANIDRLIIDPVNGNGILEAKNASSYLAKEWEGENIPFAYQCQVQWYMAVIDLQYAYVATRIGGNKFNYIRVERDNAVIAALIEAGSNFWDCVVTNTPPAVDGTEATSQALSAIYPEGIDDDTPVELELPVSDIEHYFELKGEAKELDEKITFIENQLKAELGAHQRGTVGGTRVNWTNTTTTRLDTKEVKAKEPELFAKYAKVSTSRRFTITPEKGGK